MPKKLRLIIFFIPPDKIVNGGVLSIFSIAKESRKHKSIHGAEVLICTVPGTKSYKHNDLFQNDETIYSFDEVVARGNPDYLMLHVPEYASYNTTVSLEKYRTYLSRIPDLRVNIMNQNILLMQEPVEVARWFSFTPNVTQTTAHNKYTSQELADQYFLPTKHFSTFVDASQYQYTKYADKSKLIALSPDLTPLREPIVASLKKALPDYKIVTINDMSYEEYKKFITTARFVVTFGEGFDGYYVEGYFTGGITFAVYNDEFFPNKEFGKFKNTFSSYEDMLENLSDRMNQLDKEAAYNEVVQQNLSKINELYSFKRYQDNIREFYLGNFSYMPQAPSAQRLIGALIEESTSQLAHKDKLIAEKDKAISEMAVMIEEKEAAYQNRNKVVAELESSLSWRVTKPLRKASSAVRKRS